MASPSVLESTPRKNPQSPREKGAECEQHQGLTPGMQRREDAWLRPEILGVCQQGAQSVADRLKQQSRHDRDVGQPQRVELMGQGEDDMVMITGQEPRLLHSQPALGLEIR